MQHSLVVQTDAAHVTDAGFAIKTLGEEQPAKPVHLGAFEKQNNSKNTHAKCGRLGEEEITRHHSGVKYAATHPHRTGGGVWGVSGV